MVEKSIIKRLRAELRKHIDSNLQYDRYYNEPVVFYGVRTPVVRTIARQLKTDVMALEIGDFWRLVMNLYSSDFNEEAIVATQWLVYRFGDLSQDDFARLEDIVCKYLNNWSKVDDFCTHVMFPYLCTYSDLATAVGKWCQSDNLWVRRSSAVSFIDTSKEPLDMLRFRNYVFWVSECLLNDEEDLVLKAYGWLLKVFSKVAYRDVYRWVFEHKQAMPRVALRYAIELMDDGDKRVLMDR